MCPCTQVDLSALLSPALFPEPRFYPASLIGVVTSETVVSSVTVGPGETTTLFVTLAQ